MPPSALGQLMRPIPEQLGITMKQCYLRDYEKKIFKACWCPQVPKISLLKLLTGLTDIISTSVEPQLPTRCRHQVHISHPGAQGFHHSTSARRALFSSLPQGPLLPKPISHQPRCLLATYQQVGEHKKRCKDTGKSFSIKGTQMETTVADRQLHSGSEGMFFCFKSKALKVKTPNFSSAINF